MIRAIYRALLWLHPAVFEEQFGEEFLWIFDLQRESGSAAVGLVADCFVSLWRQWLFHSGLWTFGVGLVVNGVLILCSVIAYLRTPSR